MNPATPRPLMQKIHIEITNVCNLKCHFCPPVERKAEFMTFSNFEKILDKVAPHTEWICLHLMGEPMAHPEFPEIVRACHRRNKKVYLVTNGILLQRHRKILIEAPYFHQINVSVHSFWDNFPQGDLQKYLNTLATLLTEVTTAWPETYVNYRFWDLGARTPQGNLAIQYLWNWYGHQDSQAPVEWSESRNKRCNLRDSHFLHFDSRFDWPSLNSDTFYGTAGRCHALSTHLGIHCDGTVVPCCLDKEGSIPLGNLLSDSLETIFASKRAQALILGFNNNQRIEKLCQTCGFINRFQKPVRHIRHTGDQVDLKTSSIISSVGK